MNALVERLAREAGGYPSVVDCDPPVHYYHFSEFDLERFAALVAAECARVCEQRAAGYKYETDPWAAEHVSEAGLCRDAIRAAFPMPKE